MAYALSSSDIPQIAVPLQPNETKLMDQEIKNQILLTGGYGFLGGYIRLAFEQHGYEVISLGRSELNDIQLDLSKEQPELDEFPFSRVIHCAGLAHKIPEGKDGAQEFYNVNLEGTENLLLSLVPHVDQIRQFVFISSAAVYGKFIGYSIPEDVSLDGKTPYAKSKIYAEEQVRTWCEQYGVPGLILRLPVVAGRNAPQSIRDIIRGLEKGKYLRIGKGNTQKSMVLAEDVALHLLKWENKSGTYNLTDGHHPTFSELESYLAHRLQLKLPKSMPDWQARVLSGMGDLIPGFPIHSRIYQQITSDMIFDDTKARKELDWNPRKVMEADWL